MNDVNQAFRVDGRVALVTGSSTGIGLAIARGLAQAGASVVLNGRSAARLDAARAALAAEGLVVRAEVFDVTDTAAVDAGVARIEAEVGAIDILVNNAGIARRASLHQISDSDWQAVMDSNVGSAMKVGRAVARGMVARRRGRIVNICSVMSEIGRPGTGAYMASKGALKMLTKAMALDFAPYGITANAIAPGYFPTELTEPLIPDPEFRDWIAGRAPLGRWGELHELAPVAVFLASDASSYITGHLLMVDGGTSAAI